MILLFLARLLYSLPSYSAVPSATGPDSGISCGAHETSMSQIEGLPVSQFLTRRTRQSERSGQSSVGLTLGMLALEQSELFLADIAGAVL